MVQIEEPSSSPLSTLSDDCVLEIFGRMPDIGLLVMANTCKRFRDLAAIQYRRVHPTKAVRFHITEDKVEIHPLNHWDVQAFGHKMLNVVIRGVGQNWHMGEHGLTHIATNCSPSLKTVRFEHMMLSKLHTQALGHLLHRVESLTFHRTTFIDDFFQDFLVHCTVLKHLTISESIGMVEPDATRWLCMQYPHLQSVCISSTLTSSFSVGNHWDVFFQRNPRINTFSCHFMYTNDSAARPLTAIERHAHELQRLYLSLHGIGHLNSTYYDLSVLCAQRQFKFLELHVGQNSAPYLLHHNKMLATYGALKALHFTKMTVSPVLCTGLMAFKRIQQLHFTECDIGAMCAEYLAKDMADLRRLCGTLTMDELAPFIRNARKLSEVHLKDARLKATFDATTLDKLNEERAQLVDASAVTIYIKLEPEADMDSLFEMPRPFVRFKAQPNDEMFTVQNTFSSLFD